MYGSPGLLALRFRQCITLKGPARCRQVKSQAIGAPAAHPQERIMPLQVASTVKPPSWPMSIGAAGIAAAQFARCGFDVMMQAGPDKPWYDLVVTKAGTLLKIGVKAT